MIMYHFTKTCRLGEDEPISAIGEWLIHYGSIKLYKSGLHAFKHPSNALHYTIGCQLHQVELGGEIIHDQQISVGSHRKVLATVDINNLLKEYAVWCVERAQKRLKEIPEDLFRHRNIDNWLKYTLEMLHKVKVCTYDWDLVNFILYIEAVTQDIVGEVSAADEEKEQRDKFKLLIEEKFDVSNVSLHKD